MNSIYNFFAFRELYHIPRCSLIKAHVTPTTELLDAYHDFLFLRHDQFSVREGSGNLASLLKLQCSAITYFFQCVNLGMCKDSLSIMLVPKLLLPG